MTTDTAQAYERLIERFVVWAQSEQEVRGAFAVGSRGRTLQPADEWADLDLVVLAARPERFLSTTDWLENIAKPVLSFRERGLAGEGERRVLFEGGLDVDFAIVPTSLMESPLLDSTAVSDLSSSIQAGVRLVLDKGGVAALIARLAAEARPEPLPSPEEFLQLVSDFWFHTVWAAKHLRRGELWRAAWCCNAYLKDRLLRALEWHARASGRLSSDASPHGHFVEKWVDPRWAAALPHVFAHYDEDDVRRALLATMSLFRRVASETAEALGYPSPDGDAEQVRRMVTSLFV